MQYAWYDIIGSIGVGLLILTYTALQLEKIRSEALLYSLLNALGASLILISLIYSFNFAAFIVEFFWMLISIYGIIKYFLKGEKVKRSKGEKVKKFYLHSINYFPFSLFRFFPLKYDG